VMDDNDGYLSPALYQRVEGDARKLVQALGYDMDTVEFAIRDGIPYAIDFLNPAPDFDDFSIKQQNFAWVLDTMTDLVIAYAQGNAEAPRGYIWQENPFRPTPPASPFAVASSVPTAPTGAPATPAVASPPASPTTTTTVESKPRGRAKGSKASSAAPISSGGDGIPEESGAPAAAPKRRRGKTE